MTDQQIEHMVARFLNWRLPENFNPDAGISFKRMFNENTDHPMKHEPTGTNLFDYTQTKEMILYLLHGLPDVPSARPAEAGTAARRAAYRILEKFGKVHDAWLETCALYIEEETGVRAVVSAPAEAGTAEQMNAGISTCPVCKRTWIVTPTDDCCLPACGCFGNNTSATNLQRPCESCGIEHYLKCTGRAAAVSAPDDEYDEPITSVERNGNDLAFKKGNCVTGVDLTKPSTLLYALTGYVHPDFRNMLDEIRWELEKREAVSAPPSYVQELRNALRMMVNHLESWHPEQCKKDDGVGGCSEDWLNLANLLLAAPDDAFQTSVSAPEGSESSDTEREAFEKWARTEAFVGPLWKHVDPCKRDNTDPQDYHYIDVRNAWRSWQAAWHSRAGKGERG